MCAISTYSKTRTNDHPYNKVSLAVWIFLLVHLLTAEGYVKKYVKLLGGTRKCHRMAYSVFQGFRQAKSANGGSILSSS